MTAIGAAKKQVSNALERQIDQVIAFDDGLPDLSPIRKAVKSNPLRLLNPVDLVFELWRPQYFRKTQFTTPDGDQGWFGPDSAVWYVFAYAPTTFVAAGNAAIYDILNESIEYSLVDHSMVLGRNPDGTHIPGTISTKGIWERLGRTFSFFHGVAFGPTDVADSVVRAVTGLHKPLKGVRPDGTPYDAADPEFFRWTYCTVVDAVGSAHLCYHPDPLTGDRLDEFYREFARVGEAMGGVDLPTTRAQCRDILVNAPSAKDVAINVDNIGFVQRPDMPWYIKPFFNYAFWVVLNTMPDPVHETLGFQRPAPAVEAIYTFVAKSVIRLAGMPGAISEVKQATKRVAAQP